MNVLSTAILRKPIENGDTELCSVDFLVDGVSLFSSTKADQADLAGCFMSLCIDGVNEKLAEVFLGEQPAELPEDRIGLFVCPLCGSLSCGAITFQLSRSADLIRWSAFAYEYDDDEHTRNFERYSSIGPFEFDPVSYRETIEAAVALVSPQR
jgi:hypothetical protein